MQTGVRPILRLLLGALLLGAILIWPAVLNRAPLLFPDSTGYYRAGEVSIETAARALVAHVPAGPAKAPSGPPRIDARGDGVSTERSVFYGVDIASQFDLAGFWLVIATQAFVVALGVLISLRRLGVEGRAALVIGAVLAAITGVAVFSSTIMPDVFCGLMIVGIALLLAYGDVMAPWERTWHFAIIAAAVLFHRAHLAVAAGTLLLALPCLLILKRPRLWTTLSLAALLSLAGLAHTGVDKLVQKVTNRPPVTEPFLLARVIGDGTAVRYLRTECATRQFVTCRLLSRMPMTENNFLWSRDPHTGGFASFDGALRSQISGEEKEIVLGAVAHYPFDQLAASVRNAVAQFFVVGVTEFHHDIQRGLATPDSRLRPTLVAYGNSLAGQRRMPLEIISRGMLAAYVLALLALAGIAIMEARRDRRRDPAVVHTDLSLRFWTAAAIVTVGLIVNAGVSGVLSGVFDRYQGRLVWLPAMFAMAALAILARENRLGFAARGAAPVAVKAKMTAGAASRSENR